jgi:hypothetical protein
MLRDTCLLTGQGDHALAVACFAPLFMLIDELDHGTEIVWFEERGSLMLSADKNRCWTAYVTSLAAAATAEEFAVTAVPLIRRHTWQSSAAEAYEMVVQSVTTAQREYLDAEMGRQRII